MPKEKSLTEKEALKLAQEQGIEFIDTFSIEGQDETYESLAEAQKAAKKGDNIIQTRRQK